MLPLGHWWRCVGADCHVILLSWPGYVHTSDGGVDRSEDSYLKHTGPGGWREGAETGGLVSVLTCMMENRAR